MWRNRLIRPLPPCPPLQHTKPYLSLFLTRSPHINANPNSLPPNHPRQRHPESELDRHLLNPWTTENSRSGTDDEAAHHPWSFDPQITDPSLEVQAAEAECALDTALDEPLYVSPGNIEVSRFLDPMAGGAAHNAVKPGCSGMGWTRKGHVFRVRDVPGDHRFERYERVLREIREKGSQRKAQGGATAGRGGTMAEWMVEEVSVKGDDRGGGGGGGRAGK
ncbi:uncharacterized protein BO97DRAFT_476847 [Aspergillus homomorphus CBS 101889]|uniref:Uncharacterized protein n=1 Tax=Aspergillus homomorphus (strain CBS 101889) TaxID=1450537 RepID=A0A395I2Z8_ASPHC|nr:hypothetical protein BO97DRAFT_476847 [Aspergillus homomorphus CBS 101889]RAL14086.1 hypothetical protein BO97DRAFT_476847 [Aspergillus homomorphus CBS 101889]